MYLLRVYEKVRQVLRKTFGTAYPSLLARMDFEALLPCSDEFQLLLAEVAVNPLELQEIKTEPNIGESPALRSETGSPQFDSPPPVIPS